MFACIFTRVCVCVWIEFYDCMVDFYFMWEKGENWMGWVVGNGGGVVVCNGMNAIDYFVVIVECNERANLLQVR